MSPNADEDRDVLAAVMADELQEVVEELHGIDPVDLVSFIRFGRFSAIEDLLQSATELFFREGTLTFGWTAAVDMAWGEIPSVTLGMEFNHQSVSVFFNLTLRAMSRCVDVAGVLFDPVCASPAERLARLTAALADAQVPRRAPAGPSLLRR